jgi:hypothetical protein
VLAPERDLVMGEAGRVEDEAQAEEKPVEAPLILKWATRLNCTVPAMLATTPSGGQRITPCVCMRLTCRVRMPGEPAEAA